MDRPEEHGEDEVGEDLDRGEGREGGSEPRFRREKREPGKKGRPRVKLVAAGAAVVVACLLGVYSLVGGPAEVAEKQDPPRESFAAWVADEAERRRGLGQDRGHFQGWTLKPRKPTGRNRLTGFVDDVFKAIQDVFN